MSLTAEHLRQIVHYDPDTGILTWRRAPPNSKKKAQIGDVAGWEAKGRIVLTIDGRNYQAGPLIWLYMTGEWPIGLIDHKDNVGINNRWLNFREADRHQNAANSKRQSNNRSGLKGVSWSRAANKWLGRINVHRKPIHLGVFDCKAAAHFAYIVAADTYFGEFARSA